MPVPRNTINIRMRIFELESKPKLLKLHYFSVDDEQAAIELGMKQDRKSQWYLPQYTTSGRGFDMKASSAIRIFGKPIKTINLN